MFLTKIPITGDMNLDIQRIKIRRRVMACLLRHGADGVWGHCYCRYRYNSSLLGALSEHVNRALAEETGLSVDYVQAVMHEHRTAVGHHGGEMRCSCGDVYDSSFASYGTEQHEAEALAANLNWDELRRVLSHRWPGGAS